MQSNAHKISPALCILTVLALIGGQACGDKRVQTNNAPANAQSKATATDKQAIASDFGELINTGGFSFYDNPENSRVLNPASSPALLLDSSKINSNLWHRVLLANSQIAWTPDEILKKHITQCSIYARDEDIDASNLPLSNQGSEGFEWHEWSKSPTQNSMRIVDVTGEQYQETPPFISSQGRQLHAEEANHDEIAAARPYYWPQIKVSNGQDQSWISLKDIVVDFASDSTPVEFNGVINPPFLSAAVTQLKLKAPAGQLKVWNLAKQISGVELVGATGMSIQQLLIAPADSAIAYVLCLANKRGDFIYHIQWNNRQSRSIGFFDDDNRVSTPLLIGFETDSGSPASNGLTLKVLQISGDEQQLMKISIAGSLAGDSSEFVKSIDY